MTSPNILTLRDILNDTTDILELKDDVVLWSFQYGYLLAASQLQCFIFKENNWNCPITVDLRDKCPQFLKQCEKYGIPFYLQDSLKERCFLESHFNTKNS